MGLSQKLMGYLTGGWISTCFVQSMGQNICYHNPGIWSSLSTRAVVGAPRTLIETISSCNTEQPRRKRLPPLVREFKQVCVLKGPISDMWQRTTYSDWRIPVTVECKPPHTSIPSGSKLLRSQIHGGNGERAWGGNSIATTETSATDAQQTVECAGGIPWEPWEFVEQAKAHGHPKLFVHGVPKPLEQTISWIVSETPCNIAKYRSAVAMKWTSKAVELKDQEEKLKADMPGHCRRILAEKRLALLDAMISEAGYRDTGLVANICRGFDLMGPLPMSNVFPSKHTFATVAQDQVRSVCSSTRQAVWHSLRKVVDADNCRRHLSYYDWGSQQRLVEWACWHQGHGPWWKFDTQTRRFGISQTSSSSDGVQTRKTRPIDDFTESRINLSNSTEEKIDTHSVDVILASVLLRLRKSGEERKELHAKAIDRRKAYKQLALPESETWRAKFHNLTRRKTETRLYFGRYPGKDWRCMNFFLMESTKIN